MLDFFTGGVTKVHVVLKLTYHLLVEPRKIQKHAIVVTRVLAFISLEQFE